MDAGTTDTAINMSDAAGKSGETVAPRTGRETPGHWTRQVLFLAVIILCSFVSYLVITHFLFMAVEIKGVSMSPTLMDGERYLLYRCTYLVRDPRMGEIVVIKDPEDHGLSIKRIVGLPEELVQVRRDGLYINDSKVPEPYLLSKYTFAPRYEPTQPLKLDKDQYYVMGDNRNRSADSRIYGPVSRDAILGVIAK
jgi:signal peptidase I